MDEDRQLILDYIFALTGDPREIAGEVDIAGYAATLATDELLRCHAPELWFNVHAALRRDVDHFLVGRDPSVDVNMIRERFSKLRERK